MGDDELDEEEESIGLLVKFILKDIGRSLDIAFLGICVESVQATSWAGHESIPSTICSCCRNRCWSILNVWSSGTTPRLCTKQSRTALKTVGVAKSNNVADSSGWTVQTLQ